jgi:hypothetical protein
MGTVKSKRSKQELDQDNLKKNLIYLLENYEKYISSETRMNYLMGIGVSCVSGEFALYYGSNPINEEIKMLRKNNGH